MMTAPIHFQFEQEGQTRLALDMLQELRYSADLHGGRTRRGADAASVRRRERSDFGAVVLRYHPVTSMKSKRSSL